MPVTIDRFTEGVTSPAGYDATFLSTTDLGAPTRPGLVVLPYTHFTVAIDPVRCLAASTAVNIDGSQLREVERGDDWRLDPRLPAAQQAGPELYASNDLDRGHLVRRRDPVWGTAAVAERANVDTFHYTVCAPQTATLNQSKTLWLGLEDYVLEHARQYGQRLSVFSGCIFVDDDPVYRGVAIPCRFFKIASWAQDSELAATGYILDQTPSLGPVLERPARRHRYSPTRSIQNVSGTDRGHRDSNRTVDGPTRRRGPVHTPARRTVGAATVDRTDCLHRHPFVAPDPNVG